MQGKYLDHFGRRIREENNEIYEKFWRPEQARTDTLSRIRYASLKKLGSLKYEGLYTLSDFEKDSKSISHDELSQLIHTKLLNDHPSWTIIEGESGAGKSIAMMTLALDCLDHAQKDSSIVPLFFHAGEATVSNSDRSNLGLRELVYTGLFDGEDTELTTERARKVLKSDNHIVIYIDTFASEGKPLERLPLYQFLTKFRDKFSIVTACRPNEAEKLEQSLKQESTHQKSALTRVRLKTKTAQEQQDIINIRLKPESAERNASPIYRIEFANELTTNLINQAYLNHPVNPIFQNPRVIDTIQKALEKLEKKDLKKLLEEGLDMMTIMHIYFQNRVCDYLGDEPSEDVMMTAYNVVPEQEIDSSKLSQSEFAQSSIARMKTLEINMGRVKLILDIAKLMNNNNTTIFTLDDLYLKFHDNQDSDYKQLSHRVFNRLSIESLVHRGILNREPNGIMSFAWSELREYAIARMFSNNTDALRTLLNVDDLPPSTVLSQDIINVIPRLIKNSDIRDRILKEYYLSSNQDYTDREIERCKYESNEFLFEEIAREPYDYKDRYPEDLSQKHCPRALAYCYRLSADEEEKSTILEIFISAICNTDDKSKIEEFSMGLANSIGKNQARIALEQYNKSAKSLKEIKQIMVAFKKLGFSGPHEVSKVSNALDTENYSLWAQALTMLELDLIKSTFPIDEYHNHDGKILFELACGQGRLSKLIHEEGYNFAGCDIELPLLIRYRTQKALYPSHVMQADYLKLPLSNNSVNGLLCMMHSIFYITTSKDRNVFFKNAYNVLKPGGKLVIDTVDPTQGSYRKKLSDNQIININSDIDNESQNIIYDHLEGHENLSSMRYVWSEEEIEKLANLYSFTIELKQKIPLDLTQKKFETFKSLKDLQISFQRLLQLREKYNFQNLLKRDLTGMVRQLLNEQINIPARYDGNINIYYVLIKT